MKQRIITGLSVMITLFLYLNCSYRVQETGKTETEQDNSGQFIRSSFTLGDTRSFGIASGDVDGDNDIDIFIPNYVGPSHLWLNNGDGTFTPGQQDFSIEEVHDAAIADLNGDNFPDLVLVSHAGPNKIYFNDGRGNFTESNSPFGIKNQQYLWLTLTDVDKDGDIDGFVYSISSGSRLLLNDGMGNFEPTKDEYGDRDTKGYEISDIDGDKYPDLILIQRQKPNQIWLNDKNGLFINTGKTVGEGGNDIDCGDIDGDGKRDLIITDIPGKTEVWLNKDNKGAFIRGYETGYGALKCELVDADMDGDIDLFTSSPEKGTLLWLNDGKGIYILSDHNFGTSRVLRIWSGDLDGDSDPDIILGQTESSGGNAVYINQAIVTK